MRITNIGTDYIGISEDNIDNVYPLLQRIHLIKLKFKEPTEEKIHRIIEEFSQTNRYVIEDNIRIYNSILKNTTKKYYVENNVGDSLISFFRRNNKILLNTRRLSEDESTFVFNNIVDILKNIEVILMDYNNYEKHCDILNEWTGNVIIYKENKWV